MKQPIKSCFPILFLIPPLLLFGQDSSAIYTMADTVLARQYMEMADSLKFKKQYDDALELERKASSIYMQTVGEMHILTAQNYISQSYIYRLLKRYDDGLKTAKKSLEICLQTVGERNYVCGEAYFVVGLLLGRKLQYDDAILSLEKALSIYKVTLNENHPLISDVYMDIGAHYYYKGDYGKAFSFSQNGLLIHLNSTDQDYQQIYKLYTNLGIVLEKKGNLHKAILYYEEALTVAKRNSIPVPATVYANMGIAFRKLNLPNKALECFNKSIALYKNDTFRIAKVYNNIGNVLMDLKDYESAFQKHEVAFLMKAQVLPPEHPSLAISCMSMANSSYLLGDFEKALALYKEAYGRYQNIVGENHPLLGDIMASIGKVYNKLGQFDRTIEYCKKAMVVYNYEYSKPLVFENVLIKESLRQTLMLIEEYYDSMIVKTGNQLYVDSIYSLNKTQIALEDYIQLEYTNPYTRQYYTSGALPIYESVIDHLWEYHDKEKNLEAFALIEKTKGRQLTEKIQAESYTTSLGLPDSLRLIEHKLDVDISFYEKKKFQQEFEVKPLNDSLVRVYQNKVFDLRQQRTILLTHFKENYPTYYNARYSQEVITMEQVQQDVLEQNETLLEYFVGDSTIYLFFVQTDNYEVIQIKKDFPLDSLIDDLREGLYGYYSVPDSMRTEALYEESNNKYIAAGSALYQYLLAPIADKLTHSLIIVPDGVLGYIPFETLLTNSQIPNVNNYATYPYLLKDHTVSYAYSATLLHGMQTRKHRVAPTKSVLAMAPFYEGGYIQKESIISKEVFWDTISTASDITVQYKFEPLPSSGVEAQRISELWKGNSFLKNKATEMLFNESADNYRIIHLTTHGKIDERSSDYSFLAFAQIPDSVENELLYVRDIYNLQLNADLVVLSACDTGVGELKRGEGIISLARAFAYAGAKSIVTTLWVAEDGATKDLMIDLHTRLKSGLKKDEALRQAKLNYIENHPNQGRHPFFWSAFIAIGDMAALK